MHKYNSVFKCDFNYGHHPLISMWHAFTLLQALRYILDSGHNLPFPDGLLINGRGANGYTFTVDQGKYTNFTSSSVGLLY